MSFRLCCLYARCFFLRRLNFSLAALSLSVSCRGPPGAESTGPDEKERVAIDMHGAVVRVRNGTRKEDVVSRHKLLVAFDKLRETSMVISIPTRKKPGRCFEILLNF
jgi:hypothetical protein